MEHFRETWTAGVKGGLAGFYRTRMDPLLTPLGLEAHRCPPPSNPPLTPLKISETPLPIVHIDAAGPPSVLPSNHLDEDRAHLHRRRCSATRRRDHARSQCRAMPRS